MHKNTKQTRKKMKSKKTVIFCLFLFNNLCYEKSSLCLKNQANTNIFVNSIFDRSQIYMQHIKISSFITQVLWNVAKLLQWYVDKTVVKTDKHFRNLGQEIN